MRISMRLPVVAVVAVIALSPVTAVQAARSVPYAPQAHELVLPPLSPEEFAADALLPVDKQRWIHPAEPIIATTTDSLPEPIQAPEPQSVKTASAPVIQSVEEHDEEIKNLEFQIRLLTIILDLLKANIISSKE
jgi:hypothetical protein